MKVWCVLIMLLCLTSCGSPDSPSQQPIDPDVFPATRTLTWQAVTTTQMGNPITDLAGYKIYRSTVSGGYTNVPLVVVDAYTLTYVDGSGIIGTTYFYVITAYDTRGQETGYSNEVSIMF